MNRKDSLDEIMKIITKKDVIISSTGLISREVFENYDSNQHFYIPGSMGLASSVGLGIAINKPNRKIFIIEGDGSILMNLGAIATIGHVAPNNLIHLILDNGAYASCSEEPTISKSSKLDGIAKLVGYKVIYKVDTINELKNALIASTVDSGPIFIRIKIELGGRRDLARPMKLYSIKNRFIQFLREN